MKRRTVLQLSAAGILSGIAPGAVVSATMTDPVVQALSLLASQRAQMHLAALRPAPLLDAMAARHSAYMMSLDRTTHFDAQGQDPAARALDIGCSDRILGETLAETYGDAAQTVAFWLKTPRTRVVLLNPEACRLGLAVTQGPDGRNWWCLATATETGVQPPKAEIG